MKKVFKLIILLIILVLMMGVIKIVKQIIDANTEFILDNENRYIISKEEGVFVSPAMDCPFFTQDYCEIDLNSKYIYYRYDFWYYESAEDISKLERLMNTKKRKLLKKYKLTEEQRQELEQFLNKIKSDEDNKPKNGTFQFEVNNNNYYLLQTTDNQNYIIKNAEDINELNNILKNIDKNLL